MNKARMNGNFQNLISIVFLKTAGMKSESDLEKIIKFKPDTPKMTLMENLLIPKQLFVEKFSVLMLLVHRKTILSRASQVLMRSLHIWRIMHCFHHNLKMRNVNQIVKDTKWSDDLQKKLICLKALVCYLLSINIFKVKC